MRLIAIIFTSENTSEISINLSFTSSTTVQLPIVTSQASCLNSSTNEKTETVTSPTRATVLRSTRRSISRSARSRRTACSGQGAAMSQIEGGVRMVVSNLEEDVREYEETQPRQQQLMQ